MMEKILFYRNYKNITATKPKKKSLSQEEQIKIITEIEAAKTNT